MAVSSINFQKSSEHSYNHNFRYDSPNYLLKKEDRLENSYWKNDLSAKEIFKNEFSKSNRRGGRIPKFENSHWEAVLNLNKEHTLDDVKKVADYLENKLNITCATISVHRDEGHYKNGKACYNFHAHLTFVTYKDGQQNWRKEKIKPQTLREIQTEVAEILKMERGQENSEKTRLSAKQFKKVAQELEAKDNVIQAQNQVIQDKDQELEDEKLSKKRIKEQIEAKNQQHIEQIKQEAQEQENKIKEIFYDEIDKIEAEIKEKDRVIQAKDKVIQDQEQELEQEKLNSKEIKAYIEQFRKNCTGKNLPKEFFRDISNLKQQAEPTTKELLNNTLETLLQSYLREKERNIELENENEALKAENNEIKAQKHTLTQEQIQEIINQALAQKKAEIEQKNKEIQDLKAENHTIKEQNYRYFAENDKLESLCNFLRQENDKLLKKVNNYYDDYDDYEHSEQDQEQNKPKIHKYR